MQPINKQLLDFLPDKAIWVEARSMLLSGRGIVLDFVAGPIPSGAVYQEDIGLAVIIGEPSPDLLHQVSKLADEFICPIENNSLLDQALPNWSREFASLMLLPQKTELKDFVSADDSRASKEVRRLAQEELIELGDIPDLLLEELQLELEAGVEVFCSTHNGEPISFCYAAAKSETFWDISVDTLLPYRRAGQAEKCVRYAIAKMAEKGLTPVWGVVDSNRASRQFATKLGFEENHRIAVYTRKK